MQNRTFCKLLLSVHNQGWNNLSLEICKSVLHEVFKNSPLKFIIPTPSSLFNVSNSPAFKPLTRSCLGLSHFREHKFNHNFQDTINPLSSCSSESESTSQFFCAAKTLQTFVNVS